jgi:hypothetical protein
MAANSAIKADSAAGGGSCGTWHHLAGLAEGLEELAATNIGGEFRNSMEREGGWVEGEGRKRGNRGVWTPAVGRAQP